MFATNICASGPCTNISELVREKKNTRTADHSTKLNYDKKFPEMPHKWMSDKQQKFDTLFLEVNYCSKCTQVLKQYCEFLDSFNSIKTYM